MTERDAILRRLVRLFKGAIPRILTGSLVGQGVLLGISPILTRLYTPSDFGALAVFTGIATVLGGLATMSWERAIVIPEERDQAKAVALLAILGAVIFALLLTPFSFLLRDRLDQAFGTVVFHDLWWLMPVTVLILGVYSTVSTWLVRGRRYGALALRNGTQGVMQAVSSVALGLIGIAPLGLLSGMAVGRGASILGVVKWHRFRAGNLPRWTVIQSSAQRFKKFPLIAAPSRALNNLGLQLPSVLIVVLYGPAQAGLFALTLRVLAAPVVIVVDAVSQYFEGVFATHLRERSPTLVPLILRICRRQGFIAILPTLVILIWAPQIFAAVFGDDWRVAGVYAQITIVLYAVQFTVSPVSRALLILEWQGAQLGWDFARAFVTVLAVWLPSIFGATIVAAVVALTVAQVALYVALLFVCLGAAVKRQRSWDH